MSSLPPALDFAKAEEAICEKWEKEETFKTQDRLALERGDEVSDMYRRKESNRSNGTAILKLLLISHIMIRVPLLYRSSLFTMDHPLLLGCPITGISLLVPSKIQ